MNWEAFFTGLFGVPLLLFFAGSLGFVFEKIDRRFGMTVAATLFVSVASVTVALVVGLLS